ncbi:hypothetical protein [Streptomyces sp. NPDC056707]|uniref:hypothetical protein n=1 Tax=Streptomyces sp. NPDC056707 TaxID=3345919 RepID=UPI00369D16E5
MHARITTAAITAGLLLAALTACDNGSDSEAIKATATPSNSRESDDKPSQTPTPAGPLAIGTASKWHDEYEGKTVNGFATVLSYAQPPKGASDPGEGLGLSNPEWAITEIKVCNTKGMNIGVSRMPWSLGFPDGTRVEASTLSGGDMPKPEFPTLDTVVKAGDCVRGKIPYAVEHGTRPDRIIYAPESQPEPVEWAVPAK